MERSEEKIIYYLVWTAIIVLLILGINADDADMILIGIIIATALLAYGLINILRHKRLNMLFNEWKTGPLDGKKDPILYWIAIILLLMMIASLIVYILNAFS